MKTSYSSTLALFALIFLLVSCRKEKLLPALPLQNNVLWEKLKIPDSSFILLSMQASAKTIVANPARSGVFVSRDHGNTWSLIQNGLPQTSSLTDRSALTVFQDSVFYVSKNITDTTFGLFASYDQGMSWSQLNNTGIPAKQIVTALVFSGTNLYAGTTGADTLQGGVYVSSDKGNSWTKLVNGLPAHVQINAMLVQGTTIFAAPVAGKLFLSSDYGASWATIAGGPPIPIYVLTNFGNQVFIGTNYGIDASSDNGLTWIARDNGLPLSVYTNYAYREPFITSFASCGNYLFSMSSYQCGMYLSLDGGLSWKDASQVLPSSETAFATDGIYLYAALSTGFTIPQGGCIWRRLITTFH
jgi:hypothetical protein